MGDADRTRAIESVTRSYRSLRRRLDTAILSFLIARDGDPKPDEETLEFRRIITTKRLDLQQMRAFAEFYKREDVEDLLLNILRNTPSLITDMRELTCAANQLLLAVALIERLQAPMLSLVLDDA